MQIKNALFLGAAFLLFLSSSARAAPSDFSGQVTLLKGSATATQDGKALRLYQGASVIVGDRLRTGKGARLQLRMVDGTQIMLGENTEFIVREYEARRGVLELTKGFFRAITGKITKQSDSSFEVRTPLAIIGVRGTDFWGEQRRDYFRIVMLEGTAVTVSNNYGSVELTQPSFGTEIKSGNVAPSAPFQWSTEEIQRAAKTVN